MELPVTERCIRKLVVLLCLILIQEKRFDESNSGTETKENKKLFRSQFVV